MIDILYIKIPVVMDLYYLLDINPRVFGINVYSEN